MAIERILHTRVDGGVTVTKPMDTFLEKFQIRSRGMAALVEKLLVQGGSGHEIVNVSVLPVSKEFRGAWRQIPGGVRVDMPMSRFIHTSRVRKARNKELFESDAEQARLNDVGTPAEVAAHKAKRQKLRDAPATVASAIAAANTPEDLSAVWPVGLERP